MTPLQQQYLRIKKQFPDTIVFFRLVDFYETFNDDAKTVSSVCNIVLTGREMGNYLAMLIQADHKVAPVKQTGTPEKVAGVPGRVLETREVVRVTRPPLPTTPLSPRTRSRGGLSIEIHIPLIPFAMPQ